MSPILKYSVIGNICLMAGLLSGNTFAQCNIKKLRKDREVSIETPERYQYIRADNKYYSIAVKLSVNKKTGGKLFHARVKYTSDSAVADSASLVLTFDNGSAIENKLRLVTLQPTDNIKLITKTYTFELKDADLAELKRNRITEAAIHTKSGSVTVPINDPLFIQAQIICLQGEKF